MAEYRVVLLDGDGIEIIGEVAAGLGGARSRATYLLSDDFAIDCATSHRIWGTRKVEIRTMAGECLWDRVKFEASRSRLFG